MKTSDKILKIIMVVVMVVSVGAIAHMYKNLPQNNYTFNSKEYKTFDLNEDNTFAFEEYDVTKTSITCKGWFVLNDEPSYKCKKMIVFLGTDASHLFYKLDTTRVNRPDVDAYCKKRLPKAQEYKESGFTASISRQNLPHDTYNFYVYYESNDHKVMRKMPYKIII